MRPRITFVVRAGFALVGGCSLAASDPTAFFREKIEPILRERCYECHSHESGKTKGGLTLDSRTGWTEGGSSGPAVMPGKPAESLLVKAVQRLDEDSAMPPKRPLPAAEVQLLKEWVELGAHDPRASSVSAKITADWWSLKPLRPRTEYAAWLGSEPTIDAFVERARKEQGLVATAQADRRTLIRRLMFDLHGLAPTPEETEAFVNDPDPQAYAKLVDRLLASPRYGERWARHWFDTIHFADTHGFEHDMIRENAWRYRDYVIGALNADLPWARFIREQLAADAFFPDQPKLTPALGFLGAGTYDASAAGTAPKMFELIDRDDLVIQTMAAFTSTTVGCARCHDHKFDPIPQEDYYALAAVFAGITKGDISYEADPGIGRERQRWQKLAEAAEKRDAAVLHSADAAQIAAEWERSVGAAPRWTVARPSEFTSTGGATLELREDSSVFSGGKRPDQETLTIRIPPPVGKFTGLRIEVLSDPALPKGGPGRQDNGNLHLSEVEIHVDGPAANATRRIPIARAVADFNQDGWTIAHAIDGNEKTAWGIFPQVGRAHQAVLALGVAEEVPAGASLRVVLRQVHGGGHIIGRLRLYTTDAAQPESHLLPAEIADALAVSSAERTEAARMAIASFAVKSRSAEALAKLPPRSAVFAAARDVVRDGKAIKISQPSVVHVLARGELSKPTAVAAPGALSSIAGLPGRFALPVSSEEAPRRVALAEWLAAEANPLTWRSIVNRVWHYHFGLGLVDTPNDLGRMGSMPSHPELLDWLAADFRDSGGSLKRLHRMIVTSAAYRQASAETGQPAALAKDAANRFLWRANRQRLDAESYRDIALQVSGQLDLTMGGPAVKHFKLGPPVQSTPTLDYTAFRWEQPGVNRRSIYRFVFRNIADPFMVALDFPDAAQLAPVRPFSASPLQALALWNDDFVLHTSQRLTARLESLAPDPTGRLHAAARRLYLRPATPAELAAWSEYSSRHGLAALCRVLLNSNEFLFLN